jgi:hypothetical protein
MLWGGAWRPGQRHRLWAARWHGAILHVTVLQPRQQTLREKGATASGM